MLYPLTFHPIFKERVWGGRKLEQLYQKALPADVPIGESWEISDRPGDESIVSNGPLAGKSLRWLMENQQDELLGSAMAQGDRFPLLVKILDAQDKLSLQVHPPAAVAPKLGGEPKTEMWYIAAAASEADIYAGLKSGVTRAEFEEKIQTGAVAECFHRIVTHPGDALFLPSGRVHAIGAGNVIFEIQQNSDTTYRVFDWNRAGLDGQPRALHVAEALDSIDFADFEPGLIAGDVTQGPNYSSRTLVNDPLFKVHEVTLRSGEYHLARVLLPRIIGLLEGAVFVKAGENSVALRPGQFSLIPACLGTAQLIATAPATLLVTTPAGIQ